MTKYKVHIWEYCIGGKGSRIIREESFYKETDALAYVSGYNSVNVPIRSNYGYCKAVYFGEYFE